MLGQQRAELAASMEGSQRYGVPTRIEDLEAVDLIPCGTVAVNPRSVRIGKGAGYADLEFALLAELGLVTERTQIATTVHDVQVPEQAAAPDRARLPRRPDRDPDARAALCARAATQRATLGTPGRGRNGTVPTSRAGARRSTR